MINRGVKAFSTSQLHEFLVLRRNGTKELRESINTESQPSVDFILYINRDAVKYTNFNSKAFIANLLSMLFIIYFLSFFTNNFEFSRIYCELRTPWGSDLASNAP